MQRFCPYLQYKQDESVILCAHIYNPLPQWCPHIIRPTRDAPGGQSPSCWPCETGHDASFAVVEPASSSSSSSSSLLSSCCPRSQSRDFDDVVSSWARRGLDGLDARGRRVTRWRPPVRGPVESVPVWAQSGRRREADDRRGDPAAFAVDPASVAGFLVEGRTTREETNRRTSYLPRIFHEHIKFKPWMMLRHFLLLYENVAKTSQVCLYIFYLDDDS